VLIDASAPPDAHQHAARALGLTGAPRVRAVALAARDRIEPAIRTDPSASADFAVSGGRRAGIGMVVSIDGLPVSWAAARTALRLAADGTEDDPWSRSVRYDELGGLALLAENVTSATPVIPDELALEHAAVAAPWMLATLHAVATSASLRAAAAMLLVHHSTLQERIAHAERLLGWPIRETARPPPALPGPHPAPPPPPPAESLRARARSRLTRLLSGAKIPRTPCGLHPVVPSPRRRRLCGIKFNGGTP
jgi:hypothetical protein